MRRRLFVLSGVVAALFGRWPARALADKSDLDGFRDVGGPDLETTLK